MAKKVRSVSPCDDSSRSYYGLNNSQDLYKGTSFNFGEWKSNHHYHRDEYVIDFVSYVDSVTGEASMWVCTESHVSTNLNKPGMSDNWSFVMGGKYTSGSSGPITGYIYVPKVDSDGNLIFELKDSPEGDRIEFGDLGGGVHIGDTEPEDKSKIWFDTSDVSTSSVNSLDIVYNGYVLSGGSLSKAAFIQAFKNIL